MEGGIVEGGQAEQQTQPVERLNQAVQQQLNLESVKTRAISLFKAVSRILDEFDAIARANSLPKWYLPYWVVYVWMIMLFWILIFLFNLRDDLGFLIL